MEIKELMSGGDKAEENFDHETIEKNNYYSRPEVVLLQCK